MSYDVTVFFNMEEDKLEEVANTLQKIFGLSLNNDGKFESRVLGLEFELKERKKFLRDDEDMEFSKYSHQLDITSRVAGADIIHPVGFMLAETLSANVNDEVMLCLSSVEFLGAIFRNGKVLVDKMCHVQEIIGKSRWEYSKV